MRLKNWGVYDPNGNLRSTHMFYTAAFWQARGASLKDDRIGMWLVQRIDRKGRP